jgi:hypothetical protein
VAELQAGERESHQAENGLGFSYITYQRIW